MAFGCDDLVWELRVVVECECDDLAWELRLVVEWEYGPRPLGTKEIHGLLMPPGKASLRHSLAI